MMTALIVTAWVAAGVVVLLGVCLIGTVAVAALYEDERVRFLDDH